MKRRVLALLLLLGLFCAACGQGERPEGPEKGEVEVWFPAAENSQEGAALQKEDRVLPEDQKPVEALMSLLLAGPESPELRSPFPPGTALRSWRLEDGLAALDLSEDYGGLSGAELTLADGCIVLTVCQLPQVERVYLTVEGRPRPFRDQILSPDDFLLENETAETKA